MPAATLFEQWQQRPINHSLIAALLLLSAVVVGLAVLAMSRQFLFP